MALATYDITVTSLKGSILGTTFQNNVAGSIIRTRPIYHKNKNLILSSAQFMFKKRTLDWWTLTDMERAGWATFASLHTKSNKYSESKRLMGFDWFVSVNNNLENCGLSTRTTAPAWTVPANVPPWSFYLDGNGLHLTPNPAYAEPDVYVQLYTTPPISEQFLKQRSKFIYTDKGTNTTSEWNNLTTKWNAIHGKTFTVPYPNARYYIAIMLVHCHRTTGLCSPGLMYAADINTTARAGIGDMIIGTNFIIS